MKRTFGSALIASCMLPAVAMLCAAAEPGSPPPAAKAAGTNALYELGEVVVTPRGDQPGDGGRVVITGDALRSVPQFVFSDLSTGLGTLPGVVKASKFSGLLYIRGSQPYETLYLLNDLPLLDPYKWGGTLLTYNQNLVDEAALYAGGFGPEYPMAMGGVLDVRYKEGNPERLSGEATLGAETTGYLGGPLGDGTFLVSYRRSFYDLFLNPGGGDQTVYPYFQDFYGSVVQHLTDNDRLHLWILNSGEGTQLVLDELGEDDEFKEGEQIEYGSQRGIYAMDVEHQFSDKASLKIIGAYSQDRLDNLDIQTSLFNLEGQTETDHWTVMAKGRYEIGSHTLGVGGGMQWFEITDYDLKGHVFVPDPERRVFVEREIVQNMAQVREDGADTASVSHGYLKDDIRLGRLLLAPGVSVLSTDRLRNAGWAVDPRMRASFDLEPETTIQAAVGQYSRPSLDYFQTQDNPNLMPEKAIHYVLGIEEKLRSGYRFRVEGYYKDMRDLVVEDPENVNEQQDGEYLFIYDNRGQGYSYGAEFFVQKKRTDTSRVDGWIGYTYAVTRRNDRSEDHPGWRAPEYDQPHTLTAVANHCLYRTDLRELFLGASMQYHTGRLYEDFDIVPIPLEGETVYVEDHTDTYRRLPDHYSVDLTLEYVRKYRPLDFHIFLQVLNATANKNVVGYYASRYTGERKDVAEPGIIPFAGLRVTF